MLLPVRTIPLYWKLNFHKSDIWHRKYLWEALMTSWESKWNSSPNIRKWKAYQNILILLSEKKNYNSNLSVKNVELKMPSAPKSYILKNCTSLLYFDILLCLKCGKTVEKFCSWRKKMKEKTRALKISAKCARISRKYFHPVSSFTLFSHYNDACKRKSNSAFADEVSN